MATVTYFSYLKKTKRLYLLRKTNRQNTPVWSFLPMTHEQRRKADMDDLIRVLLKGKIEDSPLGNVLNLT